MANGRPWFVRYANSAVGLAGVHAGEIGPFDVPFQPSNEFEELALQADPLMYHEFPTQAAAQAWIASSAGQKEAEIGSGPGGTVQAAAQSVPGVQAIGQFFSRLGTRQLWVRIAKVGIGAFMIIVGLNKLTGASSKIEVGLGRVAKGALA